MGWFIAIIVLGIIVLALQYWYVTLALVAIAMAIRLIIKANEEKKRRQAAEAQREAEEAAQRQYHKAEEAARRQHHKEEQQGYYAQMVGLGERSLGIFVSMPEHLTAAERHLDQAEIDFADRAFAPFWDSVENVAKRLGRFDEGLRLINNHSSGYSNLAKKYDDTPPEFPLAPQSFAKLGVGVATAKRMQAIVRQAQRDFQFATIYEQRKTNEILIAGFTNLAQALNDMTWRITDSIDALSSSADRMTSTLNESMSAIHSRTSAIAEAVTQHHKEISREASERIAREKTALEMLDNIQRRRRPVA